VAPVGTRHFVESNEKDSRTRKGNPCQYRRAPARSALDGCRSRPSSCSRSA
jgi:hypothetical protein